MVTLEQLAPGVMVRGIIFDGSVRLVEVKPFGGSAVRITYEIVATGKVDRRLLQRTEEPGLELVEQDGTTAYDVDGDLFRLVLEARRIRLAHLFDHQLAVSISHVEPLPHQIGAVYDVMLPRQRLRFLLADDPGAGKTIMTGLLIKELILRGDVKRCLIVVPAALDVQWQDELREKFNLAFDLVGRPQIEAAVGNPFAEHDLAISRIDLMKQDENLDRLRQVEWDLVVVDEAHKMSAQFRPGTFDVKPTARYNLGKLLGERTWHYLLLTATPHRGKEEDFQLFLALLDADRFEGRFRGGADKIDVGDMMRRMMKEDLVGFDGRKLFPERTSETVAYPLSSEEAALYGAVTRYVRDEMNQADLIAEQDGGTGKRRRTAVGFALTMLQRRLASSPEAIYRSLTRRHQRLDGILAEERAKRSPEAARRPLDPGERLGLGRTADPDELETDLEERPEGEADEVVSLASASRNVAELEHEIDRLRELEGAAQTLWQADVDAKWQHLGRLLGELGSPGGPRQKIVVFTEHRDTLTYLVRRIGDLLGESETVVAIHGGLGRDQRRAAQDTFVDPAGASVLVATDAAGEGINLQAAHFMVNYDLPWNPNRLEQRFGRIHRFGQRHRCHNWNLVAADTREGAVYVALLGKLKEASEALGGKVFDVLGQLFADQPLRDLMLRAIRAADDPAMLAELAREVGDLAGLDRYRELIEHHALAPEVMGSDTLQGIRLERERAEINRLVPHFIAAFFVEAFALLGGAVHEREPGAYQIAHVSAEIRRRGWARAALPIRERYDRVWFDRRLLPEGSPADALIAPGHPLLEATIDLVLERHGEAARRGAILVDPNDRAEAPRVLFALRDDVTDERALTDGSRHVVSSELHFVEIDEQGESRSGGVAPHLDYRRLAVKEQEVATDLATAPWLASTGVEAAQTFVIEKLGPEHLGRVGREREVVIRKTKQAVDERLTREILDADELAATLRRQEQVGKQPKMNADRAARRFGDLKARRVKRLAELDRELHLSAQMPHVEATALVVPASLLAALRGDPEEQQRARETRRIEALAMGEVMAREQAAGKDVRDVSAANLGYDVESYDPVTALLRFIEVKGRDHRGTNVTLTRNEQMVARNKGNAYVLTIVQIEGDAVRRYHAIADPLANEADDGFPFAMEASSFDLARLLVNFPQG